MKVSHKKEYKYCFDRSFASYDGKTKWYIKSRMLAFFKNKNTT